MTSPIKNIPYGYCFCGCGERTRLAPKAYAYRGIRQGDPQKFVSGHQGSKPRLDVTSAGKFKVSETYCRLIALTAGKLAIVDADDYEWLMQWKWYARKKGKGKPGYYAVRTVNTGSKRTSVYMHRMILGLNEGNPSLSDHVDPMRTTENCRGNLRDANSAQNGWNRGVPRNNTSGYKGVVFHQKPRLWQAALCANGVQISLGYYKEKEAAARAYEAGAKKYHGEFARTV